MAQLLQPKVGQIKIFNTRPPEISENSVCAMPCGRNVESGHDEILISDFISFRVLYVVVL